MAQRSVCLCHGKYIGIETIYTIENGKKINIEGKVEELRELGRNNQLFCPCGCGANLILVAGDRNLREQHFRIKSGTEKRSCTAIDEHRLGVESKILLKLWLDDNFPDSNIESRVTLSNLADDASKHELSFYNFSNNVGLCYWYNRANITSEKVDLIENVENISKVIYVADIQNMSENYQYPEYMKKIQNKQGYVLYLDIEDVETEEYCYEQAQLYVHLIVKDEIDKTWHEVHVVSDKLSEFKIDESGNLYHQSVSVEELVNQSKVQFYVKSEKAREERKRLEIEAREREQQRIEKLTLLEQEREYKKQKEQEQRLLEEQAYEKEIEQLKSIDFSVHKGPVIDSRGKKWYRCKYCGKIGRANDFYTYGGANSPNQGICYNETCQAKRKKEVNDILSNSNKKRREMEQLCPKCGSKLVRRRGVYGEFLACTGYPECWYTISIK